MKASFTHLVIDLSKTYSACDMAAVEAAEQVLLVTQLDLPCLRNVVRLMISFEETEGLREKVEIIVNRAGLDSGQISLKKAKETLGRDLYALLPNDYRTMVDVRNNGKPLIVQAPKAPITTAIRDLAEKIEGGKVTAEPKETSEEGSEGSTATTTTTDSGWRKFWPVK